MCQSRGTNCKRNCQIWFLFYIKFVFLSILVLSLTMLRQILFYISRSIMTSAGVN
jgi:hypothetical protein